MKREKRVSKRDRHRFAHALTPEFLAQVLNPAGIFGDVELETLALRLTRAELYGRAFSAATAMGVDLSTAAVTAHVAVCQLANGECTHTDEELAALLPKEMLEGVAP